jgi:hypothetical protein
MSKNLGPISTFMKHHYRHFNAAAMMDACEGYKKVDLVRNVGITKI